MKRTLLLALALIAVGCAEPIPRNLDELSRQGPQYLDPETLEPYSGPAYQMSEDDSTEIVLRVNVRDGRLHGDFEDFDVVGLYETGTYRDGQREGPYELFYTSGVLVGRGVYENGEKEGPYETYYENGRLEFRGTHVAGEPEGLWRRYYENGQLQSRTNWVAGRTGGNRHGPYESYYENSQLREKGTYNMNNRCGEWIEDGEAVTYDPC